MLREFIKDFSRFNKYSKNSNIFHCFFQVVLLNELFTQKITSPDFEKSYEDFFYNYKKLKPQLPECFNEYTTILGEFYFELKDYIGYYGVTIEEVELAAIEVGEGDYNIEIYNFRNLFRNNISEKRKMIDLLQLSTMINSAFKIYGNK